MVKSERLSRALLAEGLRCVATGSPSGMGLPFLRRDSGLRLLSWGGKTYQAGEYPRSDVRELTHFSLHGFVLGVFGFCAVRLFNLTRGVTILMTSNAIRGRLVLPKHGKMPDVVVHH